MIVLSMLNINQEYRRKVSERLNDAILGINSLIVTFDTIKMGFGNGFQLQKNETVLIP